MLIHVNKRDARHVRIQSRNNVYVSPWLISKPWKFHVSFSYHLFSRVTYKGIWRNHYIDVIMSAIASQITSRTIVYSTVNSGADQRKHQSSASLAFVRGIHRWPMNSPHKWPVTRKMFPFDDVTMTSSFIYFHILSRNSPISSDWSRMPTAESMSPICGHKMMVFHKSTERIQNCDFL